MKSQAGEKPAMNAAERERVFDLFRRWGYLEATLDPLKHYPPPGHPELKISGEAADAARRLYCGSIGADFWHLPDAKQRTWIQSRMEADSAPPDRAYVLERLVSAELFEQTLQSRYLGSKRFSLEGNVGLVPLLDEILEGAAQVGAEESILAMSHRGRLNVMVHIAAVPSASVFAGFEDVDPRSVLGSGDVKYHLGATGEYVTRSGHKLRMHLVSNPSHLEVVGAVAMGRSRAKQRRLGKNGHLKHLPIVLHGDAAFAGQGITAETLSLGGLRGFRVGGTIHVIVNNLIGFTTTPNELHPSPFSADSARRLPIPIFHVNAEDLDAVARVARMAQEFRYEFNTDVVVDLVGFRRHGHSEVDDPTITQPLLYKKIKDH
ncbi:MAG: 2-oxoglutarate dehydrogenase E1 component, partial [Acidobacteria bacterium]|nr:2-oxoglutarate dehydrogenase E1 component [Acidobacteriota bacterium]